MTRGGGNPTHSRAFSGPSQGPNESESEARANRQAAKKELLVDPALINRMVHYDKDNIPDAVIHKASKTKRQKNDPEANLPAFLGLELALGLAFLFVFLRGDTSPKLVGGVSGFPKHIQLGVLQIEGYIYIYTARSPCQEIN